MTSTIILDDYQREHASLVKIITTRNEATTKLVHRLNQLEDAIVEERSKINMESHNETTK